MLNDLFTWDSVFERAMTGLDGFGFLRFEDGTLYGYPREDLTGEQALVLQNEAQAVFDGLGDSPLKLSVYEGDEVHFSVTNLLGEPHLVVGTPTDASGLTYMLAVPVGSFAGFMLLCDLSVVVLVVVGFVLFSRYATQSFRRDAIETTDARLRARTARVRAFPGIAVVLVVTGALSAMLFMLEGLSNTARNTTTQHETIDWEADYLTRRKNTVEQEYTSRYRQRSTAMARLLSDFPELRTQERLREFNELCRSEHLMLFDQEGNELFDSHDFTGFSVDDETYGRPEWRAVLKGYIQVETPSAVNPFTGQYERTIATHVTDVEGHPDGFLLMFVNDDDLMAEIGGASLEGAVSGFIPRGGQMAAVVDNHTGLFTAHTDPSMIGEEAASYLSPEVIGRNFDGFTTYAGKMTDVYVSGVSSDGKTTLVITDSVANDATALSSVVIIGIILLLILVVFYPVAAPLCARRVEELPVRGPEDEDHPLMVFYRGYTAYLAVLCVVSFLGAVFGFWKAFEAVYGGDWTPGLHLFSIWMALFVGSMLSYVTTGLHRILGYVEGQSSTRTKTYARLVDSLASYVIAVLEMVLILTYLGVDTATIIGSVSIISIAIGMGSQDLVKDIVAGLFLVFEGDVVNMSKVKTSCTEEFTLPRTVDLDDLGDLVSTYIASIVEDVPEVRDSLRMGEVLAISEDSYTVQLTYLVNEADRESVTIRLRNAMQLLLESDKG